MWDLLFQTGEAMLAILDDLTEDDHFSIIDFNHNVRCWNEELVPGTSLQVADAKNYVQNIKPNGGEDPWNGAGDVGNCGNDKRKSME